MGDDKITKFQPVEVEGDPGQFVPISRDISTITGKPTPTAEEKINQSTTAAKDVAAGVARYGAPVAGAIATGGLTTIPSLVANAGIVGMSELTARQIERLGTDPKADEIWQDIQAAGAAGSLDLLVGGSLAGLGRGVAAAARKMLLPRAMPPEIELAQTVLGRLSPGAKQATKKWRAFKGKDPFSLTLGQMNIEERGLVTFLEGIARGGSGRGVMSRFDLKNTEHVSKALQTYFDARTAQMSGPEMGIFFKRLFGLVDDPIDMFKPVEAYRSFLYKQFENELTKFNNIPIDGSKLRQYFQKSSDPDMIKIYSQLRSLDLVPQLEGIEGKVVRSSKLTTKRSTIDAGTTVADVTKTNLLDPNATPTRSYTQTDAQKAATGSKVTTTENVREVLADPRMTKAEIDKAWKNLSPEQVDTIIRNINDFYSKTDDKFNKRLGYLKKQIEDPFNKFLNSPSSKTLKDYRTTANSFYGQKEDALYNAVMQATRKTLKRSPSAVVDLFNPLKGNAAVKYDNLRKLKEGVFFSAATPPVYSSTGKAVQSMSTENAIQLYEKSILQPLRFRFVDSASDQFGRLDPAKLIKNIEKIKAEAPEMLNELWGSPAQVKNIEELASTYNTILTTQPERSIFIQLKTAAAIGGIGGGAWSYFNGDNPTTGTATGAALGASVILMSPLLFARAFTNTTLTRALTDGLTDSVRFGGISPKLAMTFRKLGEMKIASTLFRDDPSTDVNTFYNFAPIENAEQQ